MADFTEDLQCFMYPNMETITQFTEQSLGVIEPSDLNYNIHQTTFMPFISNDSNFFCPEYPGNLWGNFPGIFLQTNQNNLLPISQSTVTTENEVRENNKRKAVDVSADSSCTADSSDPIKSQKNSCGRRKRVKIMNEKEEVKAKEVVHVRARRGQATDSHSLAERVRREKINERLRCLQDIVPGCYKTMGMTGMLDEIINYVQSLQNQVEFLSMKLTAASSFYDFNSETDDIDTMQRARANEAKELQKMMREGYGEGGLGVGLTWPF